MSWWNDLSTHRSGATTEGSPRAQPGSGYCSPREAGANGSAPVDARSQRSYSLGGKVNAASSSAVSGLASDEATWGSTGADRSEPGSLWQTTNSFGGVTGSDQLGTSAAPSVWGSPTLSQQPVPTSAAQPHPVLTLSPPLPSADAAVLAALSGQHDRRSPFANSGSSGIYSSGCGAADRLGHTTDDYGPSSVSGHTYGDTHSRTMRDDDADVRAVNVSALTAATAAAAVDAAAAAAANSAGSVAGRGTDKSDDNGSDSVRTGDVKPSDVACDSDFDEVDVGTISSLIASLQHHHSTRGGATATTAGDAGDDDEEDDVQGGASRGSGSDGIVSGAARQSSHSSHDPRASAERLAAPSVHHDPSVGCAALLTSLHSSAEHARHHGEYGHAANNASASGRDLYDLSIQDPAPGVAAGSTAAPTTTTITTTAAAEAPLQLRLGDLAPLQLTTSALHNVLASFQSALLERSSDGAGMGGSGSGVGGVGVGGPGLSSLAAVAACNSNSLSGAGQPPSHRYGSPTAPEEWGSQGLLSSASGSAVAGTRNGGSPVMRGKVNSVVAHKLNLDNAARRSQVQQQQQDVRVGAGGGVMSVAMASLDSTGSSEMFTPTRPLPGRPTVAQPLLSHLPQARAASPDSSVDRLFAQTTSMLPGMLLGHEHAGSSVTEEVFAPVMQHRHPRTESGISLPAAAATYTGGSAAQQRVDEQGCITVVDPQRRKLHVPLSAIQTTKALNWRLKTPSLCLLYQSGRCRQGDNCYQVHVEPATVQRLRADVESMPCCCLQHGDCNSFLVDRSSYEGRLLGIAGQFAVPLTRVAYTVGLHRVLQEEQACAPVNPSLLCRLHGQPGGCRFGADCKFVHVCCQILQNELAGIMTTATAAESGAAVGTASANSNSVSMNASATHAGSPHQQPYQMGGVVGTPPTFLHSHTTSNMSAGNSTVTVPLQAGVSATLLSRPVMTLSADFSGAPSITVLPPTLSQQQQQQHQQQYQLTSNGAPVMVDMLHGTFIAASAVHGSPSTGNSGNGAAGGPAGATLVSFHGNGVSPIVSAAGFAPAGTPLSAALSGRMQIPNSQQQQQQSSTPSSVTLQPLVRQAPSSGGGGGAAPYTLTTLHPWQLQSGPAPGSAAADIAGRPSPMQPSSIPGSPPSTCHMHVRTMSTQSNGTFNSYASPPLAPTPNHSAAASPMNGALSASRVAAAAVASSGAPQRPLMMQAPPQQPSTPPQRFVQVTQPPHPSASRSQQFFVQQVNSDGSVSLVPVNLVQSFNTAV